MKRIGISWGHVTIGRNRCLHIGIDHHRKELGDGLRRAGLQFGIIHDDAMDIRGIHLSPYYMGPNRQSVRAYAVALVVVALFLVSIIAMQATDLPDTHQTTTITLGN